MAQTVLTLYQNNTQFILLTGLQDQSVTPSVYVNNATLTATLFDSTGTPVTGLSNVAGAYVVGSNGNYTFPVTGATFDPAVGYLGYTLVIDGTEPGGARFHAEISCNVLVRMNGTEV